MKTKPLASKLNLIVACVWLLGAAVHGLTGLGDWRASHSSLISQADSENRLKHFWWELSQVGLCCGLSMTYTGIGLMQREKGISKGDESGRK